MEFLLFLQDIRNPVLDVFFKICTFLGEEYFIMIIFCWLAWCSDKAFAHKTGFAFCMGMGLNQVLKLVFCVQRPWTLNDRLIPHPYAVEGATGYSFPSGHTQSGVTVFGSLAKWCRKNVISIIFLVFALLIGLSRMYFGVHTPADVIVSIIIGFAVIFITDFVYEVCKKNEVITLVLGVIISFAMVAFAMLKPYPSYHLMETSYDCIKIAGAVGGFIVGWFLERRFVRYETQSNKKHRIIKTLTGIILLLLIKLATKYLFPVNIWLMYLQNFLLIFWCIFAYPFIMKKLNI